MTIRPYDGLDGEEIKDFVCGKIHKKLDDMGFLQKGTCFPIIEELSFEFSMRLPSDSSEHPHYSCRCHETLLHIGNQIPADQVRVDNELPLAKASADDSLAPPVKRGPGRPPNSKPKGEDDNV